MGTNAKRKLIVHYKKFLKEFVWSKLKVFLLHPIRSSVIIKVKFKL